MATGASGHGLFRGILFEGCISRGDTSVRRRPYHRNCGCALHESRGRCQHASRGNCVAYPIRRSWSEGCLALAAGGQQSSNCSPCRRPAMAEMPRTPTQMELCKLEEDAAEVAWPKV